MQILHVYQLQLSLLVLHVVWWCQNCNEFDTVYVCGCVMCVRVCGSASGLVGGSVQQKPFIGMT